MKYVTLFPLLIITLVILLSGCAENPRQKLVPLVDEATYSEVDFTDVKIDSAQVSTFLATLNTTDSIKSRVASFYRRRNYQFGWFTKTGMTYPVNIFYDQLNEYINDFKDSTLVDPTLDSLIQLARKDERSFLKVRTNAPNWTFCSQPITSNMRTGHMAVWIKVLLTLNGISRERRKIMKCCSTLWLSEKKLTRSRNRKTSIIRD